MAKARPGSGQMSFIIRSRSGSDVVHQPASLQMGTAASVSTSDAASLGAASGTVGTEAS